MFKMLNNSTSPREKTNEINTITDAIIAESIKIHKKLGPGLLASVYEMMLAKNLNGEVIRSKDKRSSPLNMRIFILKRGSGLISLLKIPQHPLRLSVRK